MLWATQWGDKREWLEDIQEETGAELPHLDEQPEVPKTLEWLLDVFWQLHATRPTGFSPGAVSLTDIATAAAIYQVEDIPAFVRIMRALDDAWLMHYTEQQKQK